MHRSGSGSLDGEGHRTQTREYTAGVLTTTRDFRYQGDAIVEESTNGTVSRGYLVDEAGTIIRVCDPSCTDPLATKYLVTWNGRGDALALHRVEADGSLELANSYIYSTWGEPTINGSHPNSANGGAAYGDLGFRFLYAPWRSNESSWRSQPNLFRILYSRTSPQG